MKNKLTYKPFGEKVVLIEWEARIAQEVLNDILLFKKKIIQDQLDLSDMVIGYNSLTLIFKHHIIDFHYVKSLLMEIYQKEISYKNANGTIWEIPVCYDSTFGLDLEDFSNQKKISISEIIQLHTAPLYTVFYIGFLPGFPYLSGLNEKLFMNRKPNPRLKVPKGAVGIGGKQTGIYPQETPGGWNIIGNTPIELFDISKQAPCFLKSGDQIKFNSVSMEKYSEIKKRITRGNYKLNKTMKDD